MLCYIYNAFILRSVLLCITLTVTGFMDFVPCPVFKITSKHNMLEAGSVLWLILCVQWLLSSLLASLCNSYILKLTKKYSWFSLHILGPNSSSVIAVIYYCGNIFSLLPASTGYHFWIWYLGFHIVTSSAWEGAGPSMMSCNTHFPEPDERWKTELLCKIWGFHGGDFVSSGMLCHVALVRTEVSEDLAPPSSGWKE
jgi:hypothetical protein